MSEKGTEKQKKLLPESACLWKDTWQVTFCSSSKDRRRPSREGALPAGTVSGRERTLPKACSLCERETAFLNSESIATERARQVQEIEGSKLPLLFP